MEADFVLKPEREYDTQRSKDKSSEYTGNYSPNGRDHIHPHIHSEPQGWGSWGATNMYSFVITMLGKLSDLNFSIGCICPILLLREK
jgi:hypothetical protein